MGQGRNKEVGSAAKAFERNSAGVKNHQPLKPVAKIVKGRSNGKTTRPAKINTKDETRPKDIKGSSNGKTARPVKVSAGVETKLKDIKGPFDGKRARPDKVNTGVKTKSKDIKGPSNGKAARPDKINTGVETKRKDIKGPSNEKTARPDKRNIGDETKPKYMATEGGGSNQVKEKIAPNDKENNGGVIFMCNSTTKPDCFRYKIMGLPYNRREFVSQIRCGTKLFLYDFHSKMLYGIFKASSVGGMNLEPAAFNGSYPAQVRFEVDVDCAPLPEHIFKNVLKGNYLGNKKMFNTQLSIEEVKALTKLFRPSPKLRPNSNSNAPVPPPVPATLAVPTIPVVVEAPTPSNAFGSFMGKHTAPEQKVGPQFPKQNPIDAMAHDPLSLNEKEYRAFGLKQPTSTLTSAMVHGSIAVVHALPHSSAAYESSTSQARAGDAHHSSQLWSRLPAPQPVPMSTSPNYIPVLSRVELVASVEDRLKTLNSTYATNSILSYGARSEHQANSSASLGSMPVSARYSFAGPTISYK